MLYRISILFFITEVCIASPDCLGLGEFMREADECLRPLLKTSNVTLIGELTENIWNEHCGLYHSTMQCLDDLMEACPNDDTLQHGATLKQGIGKLCEDKNTFQRYLHHSSCYSRHKKQSYQCLMDFGEQIKMLYKKMDYNYSDIDDPMCSAFQTLLDCVQRIILNNCGEDASILYDQLVKAQVPAEVSSLCEPAEYTDSEDDQYPGYTSATEPLLTYSSALFPLAYWSAVAAATT